MGLRVGGKGGGEHANNPPGRRYPDRSEDELRKKGTSRKPTCILIILRPLGYKSQGDGEGGGEEPAPLLPISPGISSAGAIGALEGVAAGGEM